MKEKDFQTKFNKWLKYNWLVTAKFELKLTKDGSLPYSALKPHQRANLANRKVIYKIPDLGAQNPFDSIIMVDDPGYVVIMFYKRGQKKFYIINIEQLERFEKTSVKKSITEVECIHIATVVGELQ